MTWILVANASEAHLYSSPKARLFDHEGDLREIGTYNHPESRQKRADMVSDRNGQRAGNNASMGTMTTENNPKEMEALLFARELAEKLAHDYHADRYQDLIIAASPHFQGMLCKCLQTKHINGLVSLKIKKDYTKIKPKVLKEQLQHYL